MGESIAPRTVHDERAERTILGMLSRTRGVGKTHELAKLIQEKHMDDGYMICFSAKEAQRVRNMYGINTVAASNSTSGAWYGRAIPFVDPEVLGYLIRKHQQDINETCDHYLYRLSLMEKELRAREVQLYNASEKARQRERKNRECAAIVWLIFSMGKL